MAYINLYIYTEWSGYRGKKKREKKIYDDKHV